MIKISNELEIFIKLFLKFKTLNFLGLSNGYSQPHVTSQLLPGIHIYFLLQFKNPI